MYLAERLSRECVSYWKASRAIQDLEDQGIAPESFRATKCRAVARLFIYRDVKENVMKFKLVSLSLSVAALALTASAASAPSISRPSAAPFSTCTGSLEIENEGIPPRPTGPAVLNCENPCGGGCTSNIITLPDGYQGAKCGCGSGGANTGCGVVLTPPSTSGGPYNHGECPSGTTCGLKITGLGSGSTTFTGECL